MRRTPPRRNRAGPRRAIIAVALLSGSLSVLLSGSAHAHALLKASSPAAGANLPRSPTELLLTFTEPPDPSLSSIGLLDSTGQTVKEGAAQAVPGRSTELRVPITTPLPRGVYTVNWRTVSRTDGHVTGGSFAFGIGTAPPSGGSTSHEMVSETPRPSALAVAGRWAFYWGLALVIGAVAVRLLVARRPVGRPWMVWTAWGLSALGLVAMVLAERSEVGVSFAKLLGTSTGHAFVDRGIALLVVGVGIAVVSIRVGRSGWLVLGALAAGAMLVHAIEGHADAPSTIRLANVADEWLHLLAVGVWVGGLPWLLLATRHRETGATITDATDSAAGRDDPGGRPDAPREPIAPGPLGDEGSMIHARLPVATAVGPEARARSFAALEPARAETATFIHRFSRLATVALAVTVVTGILRALSEVKSVHALFSSSFGITLLVKAGLVVVLAGLGALNHFLRVPRAHDDRQLGLLRRTVGAEVSVGAGILLAASILSQLPPASLAATASSSHHHPLVVTGHDFATSVRFALTVSPGTVGPNTFTAQVRDYDTGAPVAARSVQLDFTIRARPDIGSTSLELRHVGGATWRGSGSMVSIFATYSVQATVQTSTSAVTVPLTLRPALPPEQISVNRAAGQPTLYTIALTGGGSLQAYADPGSAGPNSVHFTFFEPSGDEMTIASAKASEVPPGGASETAKLIRFDKGHFAANLALTPGAWIFQITATTADGTSLDAYFSTTIAEATG